MPFLQRLSILGVLLYRLKHAILSPRLAIAIIAMENGSLLPGAHRRHHFHPLHQRSTGYCLPFAQSAIQATGFAFPALHMIL